VTNQNTAPSWMGPAGGWALAFGILGFVASAAVGGGPSLEGALVAGVTNPLFFIGVPLGLYWLARSNSGSSASRLSGDGFPALDPPPALPSKPLPDLPPKLAGNINPLSGSHGCFGYLYLLVLLGASHLLAFFVGGYAVQSTTPQVQRPSSEMAVGKSGAKSQQAVSTASPVEAVRANTFRLELPKDVTTMKQGERRTITIGMTRGINFDQDVTIDFVQAPAGITFEPARPILKHGERDVTVVVNAADDAALNEFSIQVNARGEKTWAVGQLKLVVQQSDRASPQPTAVGPQSPQVGKITQWKKDASGRQLCEIRFPNDVDGLEGKTLTARQYGPNARDAGLMMVLRTRGRDLVAVSTLSAKIGDEIQVEFDAIAGVPIGPAATEPSAGLSESIIDAVLAGREGKAK
jgi:hypothetical protein